jgi:hemerythrin-like domain-containing protein
MGPRPLADFTQPLEMLQDCHRRIEHFLDVLKKVATQFGDRELNDDARRALEVSLTYFSHAAPRHTADEEQSLFPRMRTSSDPAVQAAIGELDQLESDHRRAECMHQRVDVLGRGWLLNGRLPEKELAELCGLLVELTAIYGKHIRQEEEQVFVMAARALTADDLGRVGEEMRQRRIASA